MLARIFLIAMFCFPAMQSAADELDADQVRSLMVKGDFEAVEDSLEEFYAEVKQGTQTYEDQRRLYVAFLTSHPEIGKTLDVWLAARPQSIHSRTAKGWQQYHFSWIARGERSIRYTHPAAISEMNAYLATFKALMWSVYEDDPAFVPGSDGVLRSFLNGGRKSQLLDVMEAIMSVTPNYGSMSRGLHSLSPRWGGSVQAMNILCARYADLVEDRKNYDTERCKVVAAFSERLDEKTMTWATARLQDIPVDEEPYPHLYATLFLRPSVRPTADQVVAWYRGWGGYNERMASIIDHEYGVENFAAEEKLRHLKKQGAVLENDPLNPRLLLEIGELKFDFQLPDDEKAEIYEMFEKATILGRREPEVWIALATYNQSQERRGLYARTRGFHENSIVYSNYQPENLTRNFDDLSLWHRNTTIALNQTEEGFPFEAEKWNHVEDVSQKQLDEISCDMIRAARLTAAICEYSGDCYRGEDYIEIVKGLISDDVTKRQCPGIYEVDLQELFYPKQP